MSEQVPISKGSDQDGYHLDGSYFAMTYCRHHRNSAGSGHEHHCCHAFPLLPSDAHVLRLPRFPFELYSLADIAKNIIIIVFSLFIYSPFNTSSAHTFGLLSDFLLFYERMDRVRQDAVAKLDRHCRHGCNPESDHPLQLAIRLPPSI